MDDKKVAKYLRDMRDNVAGIRDAGPLGDDAYAYLSGLKSGFNLAADIVEGRGYEDTFATVAASNAVMAGFMTYKLFSSIRRSFEGDESSHD